MRNPGSWFAGTIAGALLVGCSSSTAPSAPSLTGTVTQVTHEQGLSPEGPFDQYNLWIAVSPSVTANAGVIVSAATPVLFQNGSAPLMPDTAAALEVGDRVEIWTAAVIVNGSAEAPPSAPAYSAQRVVFRYPAEIVPATHAAH